MAGSEARSLKSSTVPVQVVDGLLTEKHFTPSGKKQFNVTISDYAEQLLDRAVYFGEIDRAKGLDPEITHDHVRRSAHTIANAASKKTISKWSVAGQVLEYVATAVAGVGGGRLPETWAIVTFGLGITVAVILVVVRLVKAGE